MTMTTPKDFHEVDPDALDWLENGPLAITWNDGTRFQYPRAFLREHCPCATCKGTHGTPTTLIKIESPPPPPAGKKASFAIRTGPKPPSVDLATKVLSTEPVGAYAMRFQWGDGHGSGIYSWRYLRFLGEVLADRAKAEEFR